MKMKVENAYPTPAIDLAHRTPERGTNTHEQHVEGIAYIDDRSRSVIRLTNFGNSREYRRRS